MNECNLYEIPFDIKCTRLYGVAWKVPLLFVHFSTVGNSSAHFSIANIPIAPQTRWSLQCSQMLSFYSSETAIIWNLQNRLAQTHTQPFDGKMTFTYEFSSLNNANDIMQAKICYCYDFYKMRTWNRRMRWHFQTIKL